MSEPVVGAQVVDVPEPTDRDQSLLPPSPLAPSCTQSTASSTPTLPQGQSVEFDPSIGAKPHSPFYRHHHTTTSLEQIKSEVRISTRGYTSQDLESGMRTPYKQSMDIQSNRTSKIFEKKKRRCSCMDGLSWKQRIAVKILIAVIIIGTMIGIALGITAAVGGGVWKSNGRQGGIGDRL
ncbi:hypothetical protein VTN00DRAFT_3137 [Thermoascus crustaceus]|uniref:uncharacterized protein n=1 Tax=Thermoascus crustaceus TaxID=5088 RepID=UPI0037438C16